MSDKILVTGAPGNVGSVVVENLQAQAVPFRIGAFNVASAKQAFGDDSDIVHFNFLDPRTFESAFADITKLFLVRPPQLANVQKEIAPALYAAQRAGINHIVFLSVQGVEHNKRIPHYKIEQLIQSLNIDWTFLRAGFFMQNFNTTHRDEIRLENQIVVPAGKAKTSFVDTRDIGAVAAQVLQSNSHRRQIYILTGAEALDYYEMAQIMTDVLGRQIHYLNPNLLRFIIYSLNHGQSLGFTLTMSFLYTITRFGNAESVTQDVNHILSREPISFRQYVQDYCANWLN